MVLQTLKSAASAHFMSCGAVDQTDCIIPYWFPRCRDGIDCEGLLPALNALTKDNRVREGAIEAAGLIDLNIGRAGR